jgi:purine-binding chemotaxis protein CheW
MSNDLHMVTFRVGSELFGVPIAVIQEIVRVPTITHIPQAPSFIEGVINLRGRVITVIDMRKRLQHQISNQDEDSRKRRILVVEANNRLIGVIVDEVSEVLKISDDKVEPAPPMVAGISNQYIKGVGKLDHNLLILIDIEKVLTADELTSIGQIESPTAHGLAA